MDESRDSAAKDAANESQPSARKSPPKIYYAACGALCDVFWWARRKDDDEPSER